MSTKNLSNEFLFSPSISRIKKRNESSISDNANMIFKKSNFDDHAKTGLIFDQLFPSVKQRGFIFNIIVLAGFNIGLSI